MMRANRGTTLIEILVAFFVMTILCGALYGIWSRASYTRNLTNARGVAKGEAETCLRQFERDIQMARAGTFKVDSGQISMTITRKDADAFKPANITYTWSGPNLTRDEDGKSHVLTTHLAQTVDKIPGGLAITTEAAGSGTVNIQIATEVIPEGIKDQPQKHEQALLVTIREEAAGAGSDTRYIKSNSVDPSQF